ncbi:unnamed protein product [Boreogadus saida]
MVLVTERNSTTVAPRVVLSQTARVFCAAARSRLATVREPRRYVLGVNPAAGDSARRGQPRGGSQSGARQRQSKVTLVLLCASGANALLLLPEWSAFTWTRLGFHKPPVGLAVFAQVLLYSSSCAIPRHHPMTMYDDVVLASSLSGSPPRAECARNASWRQQVSGEERRERAELGGAPRRAATTRPSPNELEKNFPDVEHFWTGRRNTQLWRTIRDPVPWEREEKML